MEKFKTLSKNSTAFLKEKGSKFYAYASPIKTKDDCKVALEKIQEEHPKARHICTAYLMGSGNEEYFLLNDDGEPANSAAAPMLGQIRAHEITNTFVAVVRYFGGIKLGIGGLISAYKTVTKQAIENNKIIEVEPTSSFSFDVDYTILGDVLSVIDRNNFNVNQEHDAKGVKIKIECKTAEVKAIKALLAPFDLDFY